MISIERVLQAIVYLAALVGVVPLFLHLDLFTQLAFALAMITGIISDRRRHYWLKSLPATLLTVFFFFAYLIQISRVNLVLPVANLLVLLLAVRLVSEKQSRHILQIFVLATFGLAASTLLSLSSVFFIYLIVLVLLVTCGLVLLSFYGVEPGLLLNLRQWRLLMLTGLLLPVGSLLLMLVFFLILPRTQHPLWSFLNNPSYSSVGFSEQVSPGSFAGLSETGKTALRVEMDQVSPANLYWRGIVLNRIEGATWRRDGNPPPDQVAAGNETVLHQDVYIEAKRDRFLPALDIPIQIKGLSNRQEADAVFTARRTLKKQTHYRVQTSFDGSRSLRKRTTRDYYLQLPTEVSPRVLSVAAEITEQSDSAAGKISALEKFFFAQELTYTASGLIPTATPVETFLFESKRGYCEYFASSFALILRLSGVPARLVGGYLGGEYNKMGRYYLVSEDLAHVWVEALDDNGRWQRIDPSRFAVNAETTLGRRGGNGNFSFKVLFDTLDYYWTRRVISYYLSSQFQLLKQAGDRFRTIGKVDTGVVWKTLLSLLAFILMIYVIIRVRKQPCREERLLKSFQGLVKNKYKLDSCSSQIGLFELARRTGEPHCQAFAERYGRIVYHDQSFTNEDYRQLKAIILEIKNLKTEE